MTTMKIQIVGAGSWGLALARLLANNGHEVHLWCRKEDDPESLRTRRQSPFFLPGILLPESIAVAETVQTDMDMLVMATPSHAMRTVAQTFTPPRNAIRVSVAKGIENETLLRMSEVLEEAWGPGPTVALSGPSHAEEVARDLPASVVAASKSLEAAQSVQSAFMGESFRVYTSPDILGVELGGSLKNVIAIAAGICDGMELGDNAKAALITRGLAEMARLGIAMGADPLTFSGLSGMGDLIVTCASQHSRNRKVGEQIARGKKAEEVLAGSHMVAEGVRTARSARALAQRYQVDMPVSEQVYRVLFENIAPAEALQTLMRREAKPERFT